MSLSECLIAAVIVAFANCAVIEAARHGEIFARFRSWFETKEGFFPALFLCPFCLSYWTPYVLLVLLLWQDLHGYQFLALIPLSFAVTRLSNLLNDVLYKHCRTPRVEKDLQSDVDSLDLLAQGGNDDRVTEGGSEPSE